MSIARMTAIWALSQHKGSELLLMLALADNANDIGVCWPGYNYTAERIRMSRRQTIRLTERCNDSGELWTLNREDQRSNIYVVIPGLTEEDLYKARVQAVGMGATHTMGSDSLTPPPQVLEVVTSCHYPIGCSDKMSPGSDIAVSPGSDIAVSPGSDIAMSPDPSLTVIDPSLTVRDWTDWKNVLADLKGQMTAATFNAWLHGTTATRVDGHLVVHCKHAHAVDWLDNRLRPVVERAVEGRAGALLEIEFVAPAGGDHAD